MDWSERFKEAGFNYLTIVLLIFTVVILASLGVLLSGQNPWTNPNLTLSDTILIFEGMGSTIVAVIIWMQLMRQSEELKLLKKGMEPYVSVSSNVAFISSGDETSELMISLTAANTGSKNVILTSWGIDLDDGLAMLPVDRLYQDGFPKKLEPGEAHSVYRPVKYLKEKFADKKPQLVWFKDQTGNKWKARWYIKIDELS